MAMELSCEGNLSEALSTNRAAAPTNNSTELCDHIFNSLNNNISDCVFIDVEDNNLNLTNEVDSLILLYLNIRSLIKYHDDLHEFIALLPFSPDVMCLSESRINQSSKNIQIPGYNFVNVKPDKQTGGVSVYTSSKLKFFQLENYKLNGAESIWLKISKNKSAKIFVIYWFHLSES